MRRLWQLWLLRLKLLLLWRRLLRLRIPAGGGALRKSGGVGRNQGSPLQTQRGLTSGPHRVRTSQSEEEVRPGVCVVRWALMHQVRRATHGSARTQEGSTTSGLAPSPISRADLRRRQQRAERKWAWGARTSRDGMPARGEEKKMRFNRAGVAWLLQSL